MTYEWVIGNLSKEVQFYYENALTVIFNLGIEVSGEAISAENQVHSHFIIADKFYDIKILKKWGSDNFNLMYIFQQNGKKYK